MEKVLNQEEIDALMRAVRSAAGGPAEAPVQIVVESWDARRAGQIGREQLRAITLLHENFARSLTDALGGYLRVAFGVTLVSAEHIPYREFLQRVPETTYLVACTLEPTGFSAAMQMDLKVAFPIIDLLLGGLGKGLATTREITEIEEQILETVTQIICRELGAVWQALSLKVVFDRRLENAAAQKLMPLEEKTLSLNFEVTMPDVRGGLNLALPVAVSNALLRKISAALAYRRPREHADARRRLMQLLLDCPFTAELGARDLRAPVAQLTAMQAGTLLSFSHRAGEPASLLIAGIEMFHALPARRGKTRAATILERALPLGSSWLPAPKE